MTTKEEQQAIDEEEYHLALEEDRQKEQEEPDVKTTPLVFFLPEIVKTFQLFHEAGDVVEVRVPKGGKNGTISGYFNDAEAFAGAVMSLESGKYPGVFFTINKVNPELFARYPNTLKYWAEFTTSDKDIVCRKWLPIDGDAVRPAGISSTDEEHAAATKFVMKIRADLIARGWDENAFVFADSGNGAHLMVRIEDLPYDPSDKIIEDCLKALDKTYSTDKVKVDTGLFNASRIIKIYGTIARKGGDVPDRPHRIATLFDYPDTFVKVTRVQLEALVKELMPPEVRSVAQKLSAKSRNFDPVAYAEKHGARVTETKPWNGGLMAILETCPFDPTHSRGESCIIRLANGARDFKCQHDSCKDKDWQALKALWEPNVVLTLADLKMEDLCTPEIKEGKITGYKFDPDLASKSILSTGELQLASWEAELSDPKIWVCVENNVWTRTGEFQIEKICDDIAGVFSTSRGLNEVKRRIKNTLRESPVEFDTGNAYLVGTKNGYACNIMTGEVRKMMPEDYISTDLQLNVDYDPEAKCPEMFGYYDSVCATDCEKMALIDFDTTSLELKARREIFQRLGGGTNGKGIKQRQQIAFFGSGSVVSVDLKEFTTDPFAMQSVFRKRILILPEATRMVDGKYEYETSTLKSMSGSDQRDANVKHKNERIKFVPFCSTVIDSNTPTRWNDVSSGWNTRFRRANFCYEFVEDPDPADPRLKKLDPNIFEKTTTPQELSGYLNVLLCRAQTIIPGGVTPKCRHLSEGYQEQVFSLEEFIKQFIIDDLTKTALDGYYIEPEDIFEKFDRWAELTNGARMKPHAFRPTFSTAIGRSANNRTCIPGKRVYDGVKLDKDKYEGVIQALEEALKHGGSCANSTEAYQELKKRFG